MVYNFLYGRECEICYKWTNSVFQKFFESNLKNSFDKNVKIAKIHSKNIRKIWRKFKNFTPSALRNNWHFVDILELL